MAHATLLLWPIARKGTPGMPTPAMSYFPPCTCASYQTDGAVMRRCGSLARITLPVADFLADTTQSLLPNASSSPTSAGPDVTAAVCVGFGCGFGISPC